MRIATWNVNSIGARLPRLLDWLDQVEPDAVALQETKCADAAFPHGAIAELGYQAMHVGDGRWNGVAILSRVGLEPVADRLPGAPAAPETGEAPGLPGLVEPREPERRYASARCGQLLVTSVYVPNGRTLTDPQFEYKLGWLAALRASLEAIPAGQPMAIMGDFNVALSDADVWDPAAFAGSTHVTPVERAGLRSMLDWGLTDVPARPGKGTRPFTYWDYRAGMFQKDQGMRIDYVLTTGVRLVDAHVDREARKGKLPSDHAPVVVDCEFE